MSIISTSETWHDGCHRILIDNSKVKLTDKGLYNSGKPGCFKLQNDDIIIKHFILHTFLRKEK